jgi:hypothetical protein
MRRPRLTSTVLICVVATIFATASAAAAPRGVLTKAEYQQLLAAEKRVKVLSSKNPQGFTEADSICTRIKSVSPLVGAVRSDCMALVAFGNESTKADNAATTCALDPPSEQAVLRCLLPTFQIYHADAKAFYLAETRVAKLAAARGFDAKCVAVIGDTPKTIVAEADLVDDLKQMVSALRNGNLNELQMVSDRIDKDADALNPRASSLSVCPHR